MTPNPQENVDNIVKETTEKVKMTDGQKVKLKEKTTEVIWKLTEAQIGDFKKHLVEELKSQSEDGKDGTTTDAKLEDDEVAEAVTVAADKSRTPDAVPPAPVDGQSLSGITWNETQETPPTSKKFNLTRFIVEAIGLKELYEQYFRDWYSFAQEDIFEWENIDGKKMIDIVRSLGVEVPVAEKQKNQIGKYTVEHLAKLKIPADKWIDFLEYMAGMSRRTPPADLVATFDSARAHFETLSDPKTIADIFNFNVEEKPTTPPPEAPTTPEAPATNNTVEIALDGGKTEKIEAKAEDVAAFNNIKTSAEVILGGKEAGAGEKLKEAYIAQKAVYDAAGDKKPEEGGKILKTVADTLVKNITTKINIKNVKEKDKEANLQDDKLKEYTLVGLQDALKVYFPLAFDQIYTRVDWAIEEKVKANMTPTAKELLKKSLVGYLREAGKTGHKSFTEDTKEGYEKVVAKILKQEEKLKTLTGTTKEYWDGIAASNTSPLNIA